MLRILYPSVSFVNNEGVQIDLSINISLFDISIISVFSITIIILKTKTLIKTIWRHIRVKD